MSWNQKEKVVENNKNAYAFIFGCIVIGALLYVWATADRGVHDAPGPNQIVRPTDDNLGPVNPAPKAVGVEGSFLVVVSESKNRPVADIKVLNDEAFWNGYLKEKKMSWYLLDPDDNDATTYKQFAARKNVEPPFIIHAKGSEVIWLDKFPPADTEELKTKINQME